MTTFFRSQPLLSLTTLLLSIVLVVSFSPLSKPKLRQHKLLQLQSSSSTSAHKDGTITRRPVTIEYSSWSLNHLKNVELESSKTTNENTWTTQKLVATLGSVIIGGSLGVAADYELNGLLGMSPGLFMIMPLCIVPVWFLLGGKEITESERPKNGGSDAKLIADKPGRLTCTIEFLEHKYNNVIITERKDSSSPEEEERIIMPFIERVHDHTYVQQLKTKSLESEYPRRLNAHQSRTLIDEHSYNAAIQAVGQWMDGVRHALLDNESPTFLLVRPPSHHACRAMGMGGCLLNSVAIAAFYALEELGAQHVAILDIDAHHGNGIAHCIQEEPRIRYCSIHEEPTNGMGKRTSEMDPRSPVKEDHGPLGNILNLELSRNTGWDNGYQSALTNEALPFLCQDNPNVLLVAAGFDALDQDWSSKLQLRTSDYNKIAAILHAKFGNRVAFGLEGGYVYRNGKLAEAIYEFVKPWQKSSSE